MKNLCLAAIAGIALTGSAFADAVDPDWPCIQRRQPQLSVAQVWAGPVPGAASEELAKTPRLRDLGQVLAQRRLALPEAEALIADTLKDAPAEEGVALFLATFAPILSQRDRVMAGITRYAHSQEEMDRHIEEKRHEFNQLMAAEPKDFDALDRVEQDIDWSTRIFQDRQQSLTYVCETPVILEQRAFALGRAIASHLPR